MTAMRNNLLLTLFCLFGYGVSFGQTDFNNYRTLLSKGPIPKDISLSTPEKIQIAIETDRPDLDYKLRKPFYTSIYYSIDELLHSEICVFGDDMSQYVSEIAKKLLHDDLATYNELRFYTLKTNETNALSTDQGVIFVTTGLMSQITSEAQLAYVLAHEIAHYKRKHVLERFKQNIVLRNPTLYELSTYSKEKELEADADGLKMYQNAGYPANLVPPTFDVLMYSYLPFDEEKVSFDFYNSKGFVVPEYVFPSEKFEITAEENYDDTKSSHPNISKRKGQVNKLIEKNGWSDGESFQLGEERFNNVRQIARYEVIRSAMLNGDLTNALYSLSILEKQDSTSTYLLRMKAKIWLTLAQCKANGVTKPFDSRMHKEGEIAVLHNMLRKFDKNEMVTIALRQVYDIREKMPADNELNSIYHLMVETAAHTKNFSLDRFSKHTFDEGQQIWKNFQDSINSIPKDSVQTTETVNTGSKYDRIKKKRNVDQNIDNSGFDSTLYYLYGMYDVIGDEQFIKDFKAASVKDKSTPIVTNEKTEKFFETFQQGSQKRFVLMEPNIIVSDASQSSQKASKEIRDNFESSFVETADEKGLAIETDKAPSSYSVEGLNDLTIFKSLLRQNEIYERIEFSPVDYEYLEEFKTETSSDVAVIPNVLYSDSRKVNPMEIAKPALILWYIPPAAITGVIARASTAKNTYFNFIGIDLSTGKALETKIQRVSGKPTKLRLGALFFEIL